MFAAHLLVTKNPEKGNIYHLHGLPAMTMYPICLYEWLLMIYTQKCWLSRLSWTLSISCSSKNWGWYNIYMFYTYIYTKLYLKLQRSNTKIPIIFRKSLTFIRWNKNNNKNFFFLLCFWKINIQNFFFPFHFTWCRISLLLSFDLSTYF